jgi:hypothetical protein
VLSNNIAKHILDNFGITKDVKFSLLTPTFDIENPLNISFDDEDLKFSVFGAEINLGGDKFKVMYSNVDNEHYFVAKLDGCPTNGIMLSEENCLIGIILLGGNWRSADTYFQAMFLAGTEKVGQLSLPWSKISDVDSLYEDLKNLVSFCDSI